MLTISEMDDITRMVKELHHHRIKLREKKNYAEARNRVKDLGISVPASLSNLNVALGWCATYIDELSSKIIFEGWNSESQEQTAALRNVFQRSNLVSETRAVIRDALTYGIGFMSIGEGDPGEGEPPVLVLSESPFTTTYTWNVRRQAAASAIKVTWEDTENGVYRARGFLFTDMEVIGWELADSGNKNISVLPLLNEDSSPVRYTHGSGRVPIVPVVTNRRANSSTGDSIITRSLLNTLNSAMRTILRMEVQSELYSAPQRALLDVDMSILTDPNTGEVSQSDMMSLLMGYAQVFPKNPDGTSVKPHVWEGSSPEGNLGLFNTFAKNFASEASLPFETLGVNSQANPTSADALRVSQSRLLAKAEAHIAEYTISFSEIALVISLVLNGGRLPDGWQWVTPKFRNPHTPTLAQASDAMMKLVSSGVLPEASRVVLETLGFTDIEIERINDERDRERSLRLIEGLSNGGSDARGAARLLEPLEGE